MIIRTLIDGKAYPFNTEDESQAIGEGGEAIVMRWTPDWEFTRRYGSGKYAVKLYFEDTPEQQAAATVRQQKLQAVPRGLPRNAVTPTALATDRYGRIIGYAMPLIEGIVPLVKFMDPKWRKEKRITQTFVVKVLTNLHALVAAVHRAGVIIGDFNDKNVLVTRAGEVYLIDIDSAQWGRWPSLVATPEFSDPILLDQNHNLRKGSRYSEANDWYSFAVMVFQLLTLTHPYRDGVHRPHQEPGKPRKGRQRFPERVTTRLSVFDATVHLDKSVHHPSSLPEELGRFMRDVFTRDHRVNPFPLNLLTSFRWMTCRCGREHGRVKCPNRKCGAPGFSTPTPPASQPVSRVRVSPTTPAPRPAQATTNRTILTAANHGGQLQYVYHENGTYRREDGTAVWAQEHNPNIQVLVAGNRTIFLGGPEFAIVNGDIRRAQRYRTQLTLGRTTVAANSRHAYWVSDNSLMRDDPRRGSVRIGAITPNMTSVWAGERFGILLVQAGPLTRVQTFTDTAMAGSYYLPPEFGVVIDATCAISDSLAWVTITAKARTGKSVNRCFVFDAKTQLRATAEAPHGDHTWLGCMTSSALAVGDKLLVPIPRTGIARVGIQGNALRQEGIYRGAAGLVPNTSATVGLSLTPRGLVHVGRNTISQVNAHS